MKACNGLVFLGSSDLEKEISLSSTFNIWRVMIVLFQLGSSSTILVLWFLSTPSKVLDSDFVTLE